MGAFKAGDIVVYQVGSGTGTLSSSSVAVFLDEYSTNGTLVQQIALPTATMGANFQFTDSGSAGSDGLISLSGDGTAILAAGYDAPVGTASVASSTAANAPRVIAVISSNGGTVDTSTQLGTTFGSANNARSAAGISGVPGTSVYAGTATGTGVATEGTPGATSVSAANTEQTQVYNGQLYFSTQKSPPGPGIYQFATAPTDWNLDGDAAGRYGLGCDAVRLRVRPPEHGGCRHDAGHAVHRRRHEYRQALDARAGPASQHGSVEDNRRHGDHGRRSSMAPSVPRRQRRRPGSDSLPDTTGSGGTLPRTPLLKAAAPANTAFRGDALTLLAAPCFCSGTQIRTASSEGLIDVAVEHLAIGDRVVTSSGAHRPIKWLGHRTVECRRHPRPHETMPVRITAHAFGDNRPARDLFVSPGHAICIDLLGEVLIPAIALVNGSTIQQIEVDETTYWHVELDSHDVILAENLAAESYLDMGNRGFFAEGDVVTLDASPDADPALRTHADFCRPFYAGGPMVEVVQTQLRKLGKTSGWALNHDLELHLEIDGRRFDPIVRDLTARFQVPAGAKDVWLVSPTARPSDTLGSPDDRDLGLFVAALRIEDGLSAPRDLAVDDPLLCVGFHAVEEGSRRWTSGRARLPAALWEGCENGFYLRIALAGSPVPRWHRPADARPALALVG